MIRAKQITTLSSCARTFLYTGSRCSKTDGGSSCACPDDEKNASEKQCINDFRSKAAPMVAPNNRRLGSVQFLGSVKTLASQKADDVGHPSPLPQVASSTVGDCLAKAGITNVLSDLMNYKLSNSERSGTLAETQNCILDSSGSHSTVKPSHVVPLKKESVHTAPEIVSSSVNRRSSSLSKNDNQGPGRGYRHDKNNSNVHIGKAEESESKTSEKKNYIPQRSRDSRHHVPNSNANVLNPEQNIVGPVPQNFNKRHVEPKFQLRSVPVMRQYTNTAHVVGCVTDILTRLKWGPAAESALGNLRFSLDAYQANQILKQIMDHSVASGFFSWLKRQPGFKHDDHTYTTMVGILGRARKFREINELLELMIKDGCKPNVVTYNRLIHSYGRANYLSDAVQVFHQMQKAGCKPDRVTYCTLIDIHAKAGFLDVAMHMYQSMQEAGLTPDTFTYSVMINCLGKAGHLADAHRLFCEMVDHGCIPNLVTYNIMIALQAKARHYPVALEIYRNMQNAGFEPDKVTYSIVMEVLGHCGCLEEAEGIFSEMRRKNWVPDEPVYGLLVDMWGKAGNVDKALGWYREMLNAGLFPNVPTCNSLLSTFLKAQRFADAYNLLTSMVQMGLNPSLQTFTLLLSCCTEAKSPSDMGFCGQLMAITGHPAHSFLQTMPAPGPNGENVRAHMGQFLDLMHSEDRESKRGLVDSVVDFLHKSGLKEEAGSVWEVAAEKNVYPEAVKPKGRAYWLINLHVMSDGTAVTALSRTLAGFRRRMLVDGEVPDRIDIVTGWGRRSRVTGTSLVRQAVQELLDVFSFPFFNEGGNCGCFVGCGEPLSKWLSHSYVERMHLL
ncbi:hypothetical protein V2J09_014981 [Rumex salicifolius]